MEDDNSLSERILRTIENIFKEDAELASFDIITAEHNDHNKSPVRHERHHLGVESWCIKHIYRYAYLELFEHRRAMHHQKKCKDVALNRLLIGVLLVNPDVTTFWNMKRELVVAEQLAIESELRFSNICLSYKSKSNDAFAYRRWLLGRLLAKFAAVDLPPPYDNLLENELNVCQLAASNAQNNYHAWSHRIWSMENLTRPANLHSVIAEELNSTNTWILNHVSEHFGYHYKQYLLNLILNRNVTSFVSNIEQHYRYVLQHLNLNETDTTIEDPRNFGAYLLGKALTAKYVDYFVLMFFNLLHQSSNWSDFESEHESAWYHRRSLVYHILKAAYACHDIPMNPCVKIDDSVVTSDNIVDIDAALFKYSYGEKEPKLLKKQLDKVESSNLHQLLLRTERNFIDTTKRRSELEMEFAQKHKKWLKLALGIANL